MIIVGDAYKNACLDNQRTSYVVAKYGLFDKKAKSSISKINSNSKQLFSNVDKTYNEVKETNYNYISCEPNRVKLDGNYYFIKDKNKSNSVENIAYWSKEMSNDKGLFITNPKIVYMLNQPINFTELTLYFQEVCSEFIVRYYNGDTQFAIRHIVNNDLLTPTTKGAKTLEETAFNKVEVEFVKTKHPFRYIKFNEIDFGVIQQFDENQILDYDIIEETDITSGELSSNSLSLTLKSNNGEYDILNPKNKLKLLQDKQEISLYYYLRVANRFKELPLGTFLLKEFKSDKNSLRIEAYDDVYFMNKIYYGSMFYNNASAVKVLKDLFNYFDYTKYIIDGKLESVLLTGFIPPVEMREALRLIAEASKAIIIKDRYGITKIMAYDTLINVKSQMDFNRRLIFTETPSKNMFNNVIDVEEYNYASITDDIVVVLKADVKVGENQTFAYNDYPIINDTLEIDVLGSTAKATIINKYATSCMLTVNQSGVLILKAKLIQPTKRVLRVKKGDILSGDDFAIKKISNNLLTVNNANDIANWKLNKKEIKYNFDTLVMPFIELGDSCVYETNFNTKNRFTPTRIELTKSIIQNVEGE